MNIWLYIGYIDVLLSTYLSTVLVYPLAVLLFLTTIFNSNLIKEMICMQHWAPDCPRLPAFHQEILSPGPRSQKLYLIGQNTIYLGYIVGPCPYHGDPQVRTKRDLVIGKYIMLVFNKMLLTLSDAKSVNKLGEMSTSILGTALVDICKSSCTYLFLY